MYDMLKEYKLLLDEGAITKEEFEKKKRELLGLPDLEEEKRQIIEQKRKEEEARQKAIRDAELAELEKQRKLEEAKLEQQRKLEEAKLEEQARQRKLEEAKLAEQERQRLFEEEKRQEEIRNAEIERQKKEERAKKREESLEKGKEVTKKTTRKAWSIIVVVLCVAVVIFGIAGIIAGDYLAGLIVIAMAVPLYNLKLLLKENKKAFVSLGIAIIMFIVAMLV